MIRTPRVRAADLDRDQGRRADPQISPRSSASIHAFRYQAKSWDRPRRVVAKVEWHAGELFPRVGFVVTNLRRSPKRVVKFYNGRGTAEQWIKEGKNAVTDSSSSGQ